MYIEFVYFMAILHHFICTSAFSIYFILLPLLLLLSGSFVQNNAVILKVHELIDLCGDDDDDDESVGDAGDNDDNCNAVDKIKEGVIDDSDGDVLACLKTDMKNEDSVISNYNYISNNNHSIINNNHISDDVVSSNSDHGTIDNSHSSSSSRNNSRNGNSLISFINEINHVNNRINTSSNNGHSNNSFTSSRNNSSSNTASNSSIRIGVIDNYDSVTINDITSGCGNRNSINDTGLYHSSAGLTTGLDHNTRGLDSSEHVSDMTRLYPFMVAMIDNSSNDSHYSSINRCSNHPYNCSKNNDINKNIGDIQGETSNDGNSSDSHYTHKNNDISYNIFNDRNNNVDNSSNYDSNDSYHSRRGVYHSRSNRNPHPFYPPNISAQPTDEVTELTYSRLNPSISPNNPFSSSNNQLVRLEDCTLLNILNPPNPPRPPTNPLNPSRPPGNPPLPPINLNPTGTLSNLLQPPRPPINPYPITINTKPKRPVKESNLNFPSVLRAGDMGVSTRILRIANNSTSRSGVIDNGADASSCGEKNREVRHMYICIYIYMYMNVFT
jgi:hypothetical protein